MLQDIAFDNSKTPSKLIAVGFDKWLYVLHLDKNTQPTSLEDWTFKKMLNCGVPTSVSICSDLFQQEKGLDLVGIGTTTGQVLFFQYSAVHANNAEDPLTFREIKTNITRTDKVLDVEFLKATGGTCRCGREEKHFHAVVADKSGLLSVILITDKCVIPGDNDEEKHGEQKASGSRNKSVELEEELHFDIEFEQKIDLNVESGDVVAASEKGNRFAVACGDSKARIYGLAVGEGHKFTESEDKVPFRTQIAQIPQLAVNNGKQFVRELTKTFQGLRAAWLDNYEILKDSEEKSTSSDSGKEKIYMWQLLYTFDIGGVPLSVSISGDGKVVAVGKEDYESAVYDVDSGCKIDSYKSQGRVRTVGLDEKGTKLLVGGFDKKISQYNLLAGFEESLSFHTVQGKIQSVSLDDAGRYIALGEDTGHAFLFSLDGSYSSLPVKLLENGNATDQMENLVMYVNTNKSVYVVKLSSDGDIFVCGDYNNHAQFFYVPSNEKKAAASPFFIHGVGYDEGYKGTPGFIWGLDIKAVEDSYVVAVGAWDKLATVYRFKTADVKSSDRVEPYASMKFRQDDRVFDVALSDTGSTLIVGGRDETVKLYDLDDISKQQNVSASEEGATVVEVKTEQAFEVLKDSDKVYCVAISPDKKHFAYGGVAKTVNVYQLGKHNCNPKCAFSHKAIVHRIQFLNNTNLAAVSEDGRCALYSISSKVPLLQLSVDGIGNSLAFSSHPLAQRLVIAHGHSATVYGKHFGFGPLDRPSINLAKSMMNDPESLKIALVSHPCLTNAIEPNRKSLLSYAVEGKNNEAVDILINSDETSGLFLVQNGSVFTSPLTIAIEGSDRNMVEKILTAINSKKISHTEGLFLKGFFSTYRTGMSKGAEARDRMQSVADATESQRLKWMKEEAKIRHTVFQDIAELSPASLLKFLANFKLEKCEPEVLKGLETAVIDSKVYVAHPFRSPVGFWKKYYDDAVQLKIEDSFTVTTPERLVEAMRIPIPGMCGSTKTDAGKPENITATKGPSKHFDFSTPDDNEENTDEEKTDDNTESFIPLEVIVDASTALKDFSVFGKESIVHALVMFQWTLIGPYFRNLFFQYLVYLGFCVSLSWSLGIVSGNFHPVPFLLSIGLFVASLRYLMREINQFIVEFRNQHHISAGKRLTSALIIHFCDLWNMIDVCAFTTQIVTDILVIFFPSQDTLIIGWAAVAILLLFLKVFFYARAFSLFGPFVRMIQRTMTGMSNFLSVMLIFILGFALAFNVLLNDVAGFTSITDAMLSTLLMVYGDFSALENEDYPETDPTHFGLSTVLFNVMNLACSVTMLNLLVAILSDSYSEVNEHANQEFVAQLANIIVETQKMDTEYCDVKELAFRRWVHVLKPVKTQTTVEESTEISEFKKENNAILAELMDKIDKLNEKVDVVAKQSEKHLDIAKEQQQE